MQNGERDLDGGGGEDFENDRLGDRERDGIMLRLILPKLAVNTRGGKKYLKINIGGWLCVNELVSGNRLSTHTVRCRKIFSCHNVRRYCQEVGFLRCTTFMSETGRHRY